MHTKVTTTTEAYLYKTLSLENWHLSQNQNVLKLSAMDDQFIHFATANQLEKVIQKFWANVPQFLVLKIETKKLVGDLIFEKNPGGHDKYYHLYNGSVPLASVVEATIRSC